MPDPLEVLLSAIVGFATVLQHTPLSVMAAPPSEVIFPPASALEGVTLLTSVVVSTAIEAGSSLLHPSENRKINPMENRGRSRLSLFDFIII
jgi:hypothetical protein